MLRITARDEAAAVELEKMVDGWLATARQMIKDEMAQDMARQADRNDPVERATARNTPNGSAERCSTCSVPSARATG